MFAKSQFARSSLLMSWFFFAQNSRNPPIKNLRFLEKFNFSKIKLYKNEFVVYNVIRKGNKKRL